MSDRILVAEDEEILRVNLCEFLERAGYRVQGAADGEEALALARAEDFELVITDIRMPRLDGIALLKHLIAERPETLVLITTAYASVDYNMATNAQNVQSLNGVGTADLMLTGNSLDNVITANSGNDFINGGLGNDTLIGGTGNDVTLTIIPEPATAGILALAACGLVFKRRKAVSR